MPSTKQLLAPERIKSWLELQPPNKLVGKPKVSTECVLCNYLKSLGYRYSHFYPGVVYIPDEPAIQFGTTHILRRYQNALLNHIDTRTKDSWYPQVNMKVTAKTALRILNNVMKGDQNSA